MSNSPTKRQPTVAAVGVVSVSIIISCLVGNAIAVLGGQGKLQVWHPLDVPRIYAVGIINADYRTIWVRLSDGSVAMRSVGCFLGDSGDRSCSQWVATDEVPDHPYFQMYPLKRNSSCNFESPRNPLTTPGPVAECVSAVFVGPEYMDTSIFARLEDGTIWYWTLHNDSLGPIPSRLLCANLLAPVMGILIAALFSRILTRLRKQGTPAEHS